jgi:hypothetical protein
MLSCGIDACMDNAPIPYVDPDLFTVALGPDIDFNVSDHGGFQVYLLPVVNKCVMRHTS